MSRITSTMLARNYLNSISNNMANVQTLQNQLSTGKEISKPSDDPYKASRIIKMYADIGSNEQYNDNITDVTNFLDVTDASLKQMDNLLSRVRELLVSAGNATYGSEQLNAIHDEMTTKVDQLAQIMNTSFDGKYVFGGTKVDSKPVTVVDGKLQYADDSGNAILNTVYKDANGKYTTESKEGNLPVDIKDVNEADIEAQIADTPETETDKLNELKKIKESVVYYNQLSSNVKMEISQGVIVNYNKPATEILEFTDKETGKKINVSDLFSDIINNLSSEDGKSNLIGKNLSDLDKVISNVLSNSSSVGALQNRMEAAKTQNESDNDNLTEILSKTEDIDFTKKMIDFSTLMTVYKASLQISAHILPKTLMDYL